MKSIRRAPETRPLALLLTVALWAATAPGPAWSEVEKSPAPVPAGEPDRAPSLAVVQVVNQSGSSIQNLGSHAAAAYNERFASSKRFKVLGQDAVDKAVTTVGARLPLRAEAKDNVLLQIAQNLSADYLLLASIDSVEADVAQKMAVVRSSVQLFGRAAEGVVCEAEITSLNVERANSAELLIVDAVDQNALQAAKDMFTQLNLRGKVLMPPDGDMVQLNLRQADYIRPGVLLTVLRNGLRIATLRVTVVGTEVCSAEIIDRLRPDLDPRTNDDVLVRRAATMVPGTGRAAYDPGTGAPPPPSMRSESSGTTVWAVLGTLLAAGLGYLLYSTAQSRHNSSRTPTLVSPPNGTTLTVNSSNALLQPVTFLTTATAATMTFNMQVATDANFSNIAMTQVLAGSTTGTSTGTSSTTGVSGPASGPSYSSFQYTAAAGANFLAAGTYYWRVTAVAGGSTFTSSVFSFTVAQQGVTGGIGGTTATAGVLASPDTVTALSGDTDVVVQWTPVASAAGYAVMRRMLTPRQLNNVTGGTTLTPVTGASAWLRGNGRRSLRGARNGITRQAATTTTTTSLAGFAEVTTTTPTVLSYTDTTVTNGVEYQYVVLTQDSAGDLTTLASAQSTSFVTATPLSATAPAVPSNLAATPGNGQVTLTWTANTESDTAGYQVFRSTSANGNFVDITNNLVTDSNSPTTQSLSAARGQVTVTDTKVTNGVAVYYRIRAVQMTVVVNNVTRGGLTSALSADVTATPSTSSPQGLQVLLPPSGSTVTADRPELSWEGVSGATSYTVQISPDPTFGTGVISTTATTTDIIYPATLAALTVGTTYYMEVGIFNAATQSIQYGQSSSFVRGAITQYTTVIQTTSGGNALNGATVTIDGVTQTALTPSQVILAPKPDGSAYVIAATFTANNGTISTGSANYHPGVDSETVTIALTSVGVAPAEPTGLQATGQTSYIVLRWNPDPNLGTAGATVAATYSIQRRANTAQGAFVEIAQETAPTVTGNATAPQLQFTDSNVTAGTRYYYQIVAISAAGVDSLPSTSANAVAGVGTITVLSPQANQTFGALITGGGAAWTSTINFAWVTVSAATRYIFEIGTDPELNNLLENGNQIVAQAAQPSTSVTLGNTAATGNEFVDTGLINSLYFRIIAVDDQDVILNQTEAVQIYYHQPVQIVIPTTSRHH
jgi:hypothetical protein